MVPTVSGDGSLYESHGLTDKINGDVKVLGINPLLYLVPGVVEGKIKAAIDRSYKRVVLVGASLGAYGVMMYMKNHRDVDGYILLGPYVPDRMMVSVQRSLIANRGLVSLGYGDQDRFASRCTALAGMVPSDMVFHSSGGHNWATWAELWDRIENISD
jgi:pimeloyl-ACP methyl ester carboxylesterase